ncbi:TIGR03943 family protein [Mycobacterium crocinum]|uniref:TIGR03943 family protein n=1 Tax=Mycolicibacterium crocinum TaxID=388459 RepID=A0ABY3TLA4_9MYCO|nr:TIGR03943 family protein [Mycolicibacterium crocinum]MCV7217334.1 TIGR03943 family protein [Mycolicibacterium crocinum]ULN42232.1 TIGR03943 family protein [Mycolicibacterium crocinum]
MRRETENTLLLILGIALVMVTITGAYTRYVKPGMLPWLAISAAVLIGLALTAITRDVRRGGARHEHAGHHHRNGIVWLLVLPVILLIFVVPPALSARAAAPATVSVARSFPPLPPGPAPTLSLPEVLMRVAVGKVGGLDGHPITTTGFTLHDGDRIDLAKIVIICCAADAQLARLHLSGPAAQTAATLPENTWLRVEGTVPAGQTYSGTGSIPTLEVSSVVRIDPPANTYG